MIVNQSDKYKPRILFQCECQAHHYLEIFYDEDEGERMLGDDLWFSFIDYPNSLWETIKWWWKQRKSWTSELGIKKEDVIVLRDKLNEYLDKRK